jgi:hypothetical protein
MFKNEQVDKIGERKNNDCYEEYGITEETFRNMDAKNSQVDDDTKKFIVYCHMKSVNFFNEDGTLINFVDKVPANKRSYTDECLKKDPSLTGADATWSFYKCMKSKNQTILE